MDAREMNDPNEKRAAIDKLAESADPDSQPARALTDLAAALQLDDQLTMAHHNLGNVLKATGQLDAAVVSYRRAIELESGNVNFLHNLAETLLD